MTAPRLTIAVAAAAAAIAVAAARRPGGAPTLSLDGDAVRLRGVAPSAPDALWARALTLRVRGDERLPAVLARVERTPDGARLVPRFPLTPGVAYVATYDPRALGAAGAPVTLRVAPPAPRLDRTTRVVAVHPSAARVPANLLRWYVELSAPMTPGEALGHVRLLDEAGREVRGAFLALDEELWDATRRRVTLLFDPGRVKRGIRTHEESGAPLVAGRRYRLVIDADWRDGRGAPLASGLTHDFEATADDRVSPDPSAWRVAVPNAGGRGALRVAFGEPLDHALAARALVVLGADGAALDGTPSLDAADSTWRFVPARPWARGAHTVRVATALEDVAGNNVARPFDADRAAGAPSAEAAAASGGYRDVRFVVR